MNSAGWTGNLSSRRILGKILNIFIFVIIMILNITIVDIIIILNIMIVDIIMIVCWLSCGFCGLLIDWCID